MNNTFLMVLCILSFIVFVEVLREKKINKIQLLMLGLLLIILVKNINISLDGTVSIWETIVGNNNRETIGESDNSIELISDELGKYGKEVIIDDLEYIWYYIPMGKYKVEAGNNNNKLSKLYLDKNIILDEPINVKTLSYFDFSEEQVITINENEHIEITIGSRYKLIPIKSD